MQLTPKRTLLLFIIFTPICLIHGNEDDVVDHQETNNAAKYFTEKQIMNERSHVFRDPRVSFEQT